MTYVVMQTEGRPAQLIASGSILSSDPDRVVLKRIILSGFPARVHKKKAVVKYMFFNPEDVKWYKPLDLFSKYGRRGRIKEPLGTHGAMKCIFDAPIQQRDTVCVALYKRVFPKWPETTRFS
jgi:pre-rRNA-processing protein TSR1